MKSMGKAYAISMFFIFNWKKSVCTKSFLGNNLEV